MEMSLGLQNVTKRSRSAGAAGRSVLVTNQTELNAAISGALPGDTIRVANNVTAYALDLSGFNPAGIVQITSADSEDWPSFSQIKLTNCSKVHLKYFAYYKDGIAFAGSDFYFNHIINCSDITIQGLYAYGSADEYLTSPANRGNSFARVEGSTRIMFDGEYIPNVGGPGEATNIGWGVRIFSSTFVTVKNYKFHLHQMDAFQISGVCEDILIDRCVTGKALGSDYAINHGDMFQFTNFGAVAASKRITIQDSIFACLNGVNQQGLFFNNEAAIRTEEVSLLRNLVQNHSDNGLLIRAFNGGVIEENIVFDAPAATAATGASVNSGKFQAELTTASGSVGLTVRNNLAETFTNIPANSVTANGMAASGNVVAASRNTYLPGIDAMTTLAQLEALTMPPGYGPAHMR